MTRFGNELPAERQPLSRRVLRRLGLVAEATTGGELEPRQPDFLIGYEGRSDGFVGYIDEPSYRMVNSADLIIAPIGSTRIITELIHFDASQGVMLHESTVIEPALRLASGDAKATGTCHVVYHGADIDEFGNLHSFTEYGEAMSLIERFGKDGEGIPETIRLRKGTKLITLERQHFGSPYDPQGFTTSTRHVRAERYREIIDCVKENRSRY